MTTSDHKPKNHSSVKGNSRTSKREEEKKHSSAKHTKTSLKPLTKEEEKKKKRSDVPKWKYWGKRIGIGAAIVLAVGVLVGLGVFVWFAKDLPSADQLENRVLAESTKIYDRTGEHLLYETGKDVRRTYTKVDDMSQYLLDATVALEDKNFYTHHGFSILGILRSVGINTVTDQKVGGSTITQQFVKLAIVGSDKTYTRKIKEVILSMELERKYSKREILEFYLNEAPYGGVNLGVAAASQSYFGKSPSELTLAESALLASIPQRPSYFVNVNQEALFERKDFALDRMAEEGYITQEEADAAKLEEIQLLENVTYKEAPHFVDYVLSQLEDDFGSAFINQGLTVITSLDYDKQKIAEQAIADGMAKVEQYGGSNAALVSIDAHTGQVLAMVGSKNYYDENYDGQVNVATSLRQPGSSFKPLVYMAAWAKGYNPNTILFDTKTDFPTDTGVYSPNNYSGGFSGPLSMKSALTQSLNIPAVKALYLAGIDNVLDTAERLGYTSLTDRARYGLALVLGGGEVTLLEHTSAYATFAREGVRHPIATILDVSDREGNNLYSWTNSEEEVLDKNAVQFLNNVLSDQGLRGGSFNNLNVRGKTIAGKTGTTNDFRDAWTMGYTPSYATGVWTGNNDNSEMSFGADGSIIAAPIMSAYMAGILESAPDETFNPAPAIQASKPVLWGDVGQEVERYVDTVTGKIIPEECSESYPEDYKERRTFKEVHNILHYVNRDDPNGSEPSNPEVDPMYSAWEASVQLWASGQSEFITKDTELEDCNIRSSDQTPEITINSPSNREQLTPKTFNIDITINPGTNRSIKRVEYVIDKTTVDVRTSSPFDSTYTANGLTDGKHTLYITVVNDVENTTTNSVDFFFENPVKKPDTSSNTNTNSNTNNSNTNSGNSNANTNSNTNTNSN